MYVYDVIAVMLTGIGHVVLYIQLIRYERLSYMKLVMLSIVFMILLGFTISVTGYPELNIIMFLLFLLSLGLLQSTITFAQNLYFTLISLVGITFMKMVLVRLGFQLFMWSPLNLYLWTMGVIQLIVTVLIVVGILLWRRKIQRFAAYIESSRLYYISYIISFVGLVIVLILTSPSTHFLAGLHEAYGELSVIVAFILFMLLLLVAIIVAHLAKERLLQEQQEKLDQEHFDYVEKLEVMHAELASFRHDYMNILLALDTSVRMKDLKKIEQVYYDIIAPTSKLINHHELDILKFSHIKIPEVKSVLSVKVIAAQQQLKVTVDIPKVIESLEMPVVDFIRVSSVLLDNAVEAAIESEERIVQIAIFELENRQYFIVKNSCRQVEFDLQRLYEKRYSSKVGKRGYGLFSLKRLIDQTNNATLETAYIAPYFTQTLILKKKFSIDLTEYVGK